MCYFLKSTIVRNISKKRIVFKRLLPHPNIPHYLRNNSRNEQTWEYSFTIHKQLDVQRIPATHSYILKILSTQLPTQLIWSCAILIRKIKIPGVRVQIRFENKDRNKDHKHERETPLKLQGKHAISSILPPIQSSITLQGPPSALCGHCKFYVWGWAEDRVALCRNILGIPH